MKNVSVARHPWKKMDDLSDLTSWWSVSMLFFFFFSLCNQHWLALTAPCRHLNLFVACERWLPPHLVPWAQSGLWWQFIAWGLSWFRSLTACFHGCRIKFITAALGCWEDASPMYCDTDPEIFLFWKATARHCVMLFCFPRINLTCVAMNRKKDAYVWIAQKLLDLGCLHVSPITFSEPRIQLESARATVRGISTNICFQGTRKTETIRFLIKKNNKDYFVYNSVDTRRLQVHRFRVRARSHGPLDAPVCAKMRLRGRPCFSEYEFTWMW